MRSKKFKDLTIPEMTDEILKAGKHHYVAHKWRRGNKLNDEMQEIRTFIRSRRAVWRKMCKDGTGLVVSPLWWPERRYWLDEMSFIKGRGGKK